MEYIHKKYGSLKWSTLLQPAISVARNGFPITPDLARAINASLVNHPDFLRTDPSWSLDFAPNGTLLGLGETIYRKRYADTLETIAKKGPDAFYNGPIAQSMIQATKDANGTMTLEDLQRYEVLIRDTKEIDYRGYKVISTSAPSSGTVGLSMLKILEGYTDFFRPETTNLSIHRLDEAMRFAYGQVGWLYTSKIMIHVLLMTRNLREQDLETHLSCQAYVNLRKTCSMILSLLAFGSVYLTTTPKTYQPIIQMGLKV